MIEKTPHHEKPRHPPREQRKGAPPRREKDGVQCYKCGAYGHYARSCPLAGRSQPRENQGKNNQSNESRPQREDRVRNLTATTKTLRTAHGQARLVSGPRVKMTVELEGQPTEALVDTGSPITVVSLQRLMRIWKTNWEPTDPDWMERAIEAIRDPSLGVQTYDGTDLPMLGEAEVTLKVEARNVKMTVLVQDEAPQDLLIGTDSLSKLESDFHVGGRKLRIGEEQTELRETP